MNVVPTDIGPGVVKKLLARRLIDINKQTRGVYGLPDWVMELKPILKAEDAARQTKSEDKFESIKSERTRI